MNLTQILKKWLLLTVLFSLAACSDDNNSDATETALPACTDQGLPGTLKNDLESYITTHNIVGLSIYLHHPDHGEFASAVGLADKESNISATVNTHFASASFGKAVTVAAALKLVDQGRLGLDDSVSDYHSSMTDTSGGPAKISHLMNHTSLVNDSFGSAYPTLEANPNMDVDYLDHITEALSLGYVTGTLGSTYSYSSANSNLLGYAMEQVESKSWQQVVQDEVPTPHQLNDIFFFENASDQSQVAKFYPDHADDPTQSEIPYSAALMKYGGAGGTLYGTACSYGRFAQLFFSGAMHSSSLDAEHSSRQVTYGPSAVHFAQLGRFYFNGEASSSIDVYFHQGGGVGFATYGAHIATTGWTIFYAFNTSNSGTNIDDINALINTAVSSL